jgi:hypothetical protein
MKIVALLAAVADYPNHIGPLPATLNDIKLFDLFLREYSSLNGIAYEPLLLTDEDCTRKKLITGFEHLKKATGKEDICIFYFSGHGSQMVAPQEIRDVEIDGLCETIVCFDSRDRGGHDLADKEIAFLLHKNVLKGRQLLTIFDCCHSGTITKGERVIKKQIGHNPNQLSYDLFEGAVEYKTKLDSCYPPQRDHVTISACRDRESAIALNIGGHPISLFTHSLLRILNEAELGTLSYEELVYLTRNRVANRYPKQTVVGDSAGRGSLRQLFLAGKMKMNRTLVLQFDEAREEWYFLQGEIHGITHKSEVKVKVTKSSKPRKVTITSVSASRTYIKAEDWLKTKVPLGYTITITNRLADPILVRIRDEVDSDTREDLVAEIKHYTQYLTLVPKDEVAAYEIGYFKDNDYLALFPHELAKPAFDSFNLTVPGNLTAFCAMAGKVGRFWGIQQLRASDQGTTSILDLVDIKLEKVLFNGDRIIVSTKLVSDYNQPIELAYERVETGNYLQPGIRLSVRVKTESSSRLYIGALFLDETFLITDEFLPLKELNHGDAWYVTTYPGEANIKFIPLQVPAALTPWRISTIDNYLKLFISHTPFSLRDLTQKGLPQQVKGFVKGNKTTKQAAGDTKPPGSCSVWLQQDFVLRVTGPDAL